MKGFSFLINNGVSSMKVAAYVRVSTDEQSEQGNSLTEQQERLEAYCTAMGWDEPQFYEDDGYSAKDLRRPELTRMLEDVKIKGYDIIITTKLDRLSRRLFDILSVAEYLEKYDCYYASATEGFNTSTPSGRLVLQMLGMVAEFERERNSERVRDNMRSIARRGDRVITRPCYGYDVKNGTYVINVEEAIFARKMRDWLFAGHGGREIAKRANKLGSRTKEGNLWNERTVRYYLRRETLAGDIVYNRTYKKGTRIITRPPEEWIWIRNHHQGIFSREDNRKINRILDSRKTAGRHIDQSRYLLSGLVVCGHCGSKMNGKAERKKGDREPRWFRYTCDGYLKKGICYHHWAKRDAIEKLIIDRIQKLATAAPGSVELAVHKTEKKTDEKSTIKKQLESLDRRMQKQIEAYEKDLIGADDLKKARERIDKERETLQKAFSAAQKGDKKDEGAKVQEQAKRLVSDVTSGDRLKAKHAIRQIVHEIKITNGEDVKITWHYD